MIKAYEYLFIVYHNDGSPVFNFYSVNIVQE